MQGGGGGGGSGAGAGAGGTGSGPGPGSTGGTGTGRVHISSFGNFSHHASNSHLFGHGPRIGQVSDKCTHLPISQASIGGQSGKNSLEHHLCSPSLIHSSDGDGIGSGDGFGSGNGASGDGDRASGDGDGETGVTAGEGAGSGGRGLHWLHKRGSTVCIVLCGHISNTTDGNVAKIF
jgi:hypothetical protein